MESLTICDNRYSEQLKVLESNGKRGQGYFYIVEFSDNLVKIGSTRFPARRMEQLSYTIAAKLGLPIKRIAVSGSCEHFLKYEKCLHGVYEKERIEGTELFTISFERAVRTGNSLISKINRDKVEEVAPEPRKLILKDILNGNKLILISAFSDGMTAQKDIRAALAGRSDAE